MINESGNRIKITKREKALAVITHLSSFIGLICFIITLVLISIDIILQYSKTSTYNFHSITLIIIPIIVNILIPFIFWTASHKTSHFVNEHSKQCLNFQLSVTFYFIISIASVFIAVGVILIFILIMFDVSSVIEAYKKAIEGEYYRYPMAIYFLR